MCNTKKQPRIAVIGLGGVGGYLASMLCRTYNSVTVIARGARYDAIQSKGLVLHSDLHGEVHSEPSLVLQSAQELEEQDYIFICVKNYSLEELLPQMKKAVGENTVLIPVMNGVDPSDRVKAAFPTATVVKSLIYIVAFANPDYSISQKGQVPSLRLGIPNPDEREAGIAAYISGLLTKAEIPNQVPEDITLAVWKKYVLNCAYNVETAYYDTTIGPLQDDPVRTSEYEALVREAYSVAIAMGVPMVPEDCQSIIDRFYTYEYDASSSLQRDLHAGKPAEVETFSGYIVRQAKALGIDVPVSEKMYKGLKSAVHPY